MMKGCTRSCSLSSSFAIVVLLVSSVLLFTTSAEPYSSGSDLQKNSKEFIRTSCRVTEYPRVCFNSLAVYATTIQTSPIQLAQAALSVTLASLRSTLAVLSSILARRVILKPRELGAMKDCVENIADSVDELKKSLMEMDRLKGPDFEFHMGNLQTWVSAAMTGEDTCMDGFSGYNMDGNVKNAVKTCVVKATKLSSIALALINNLFSAQAASP